VSPADETSSWPEHLLAKCLVNTVYVCGRQLQPPQYGHVVNFPRLEIPLSGCYENEIEVNGAAMTVRLKPGAALFAPPNCWNLPTWRQRVRVMSVLFGKKQLGLSVVTAEGQPGPQLMAQKFSVPRPLTGPVPKILEAMIELESAGGSPTVLAELARSLLACVRGLVRQPERKPFSRSQSLLEDVCVFLQNNYQYDISRDSVARQFQISPNHLSRLFQAQGHMTFSGYLTHVRIDRAKHLLGSYSLKLDDVAARCGYRDTAYFCRVFRRLAKMTPASYRAQRGTKGSIANSR
jgi:AraC-like DNA-binding protein